MTQKAWKSTTNGIQGELCLPPKNNINTQTHTNKLLQARSNGDGG